MIIYKKYHEGKRIIKTTFRKQEDNLSRRFKNLDIAREELKRGEPVSTYWALYSVNKEDLK
jgi:hypothetical protein